MIPPNRKGPESSDDLLVELLTRLESYSRVAWWRGWVSAATGVVGVLASAMTVFAFKEEHERTSLVLLVGASLLTMVTLDVARSIRRRSLVKVLEREIHQVALKLPPRESEQNLRRLTDALSNARTGIVVTRDAELMQQIDDLRESLKHQRI